MDASSIYMSIVFSLACILASTLTWSMFKWVWLTPKRLERILKDQGFKGNPYKLFYGDSKEKERIVIEASSKTLSNLSNDHLSRTQPFYHHIKDNFGKKCFMWDGPVPMVNVSDPKLMREIFMKINECQKPQVNPLFKIVAPGLFQLEGEVWAHRRKLLNQAFHIEKLKFMLPAFCESVSEMIKKWEEMVSKTGSCEVDVWPFLHNLSADVISRAAFGSSYEEGRRIFQLITEQLQYALPVLKSMYIPGWRFVPTKRNRKINQIEDEMKSLLKEIIYRRQSAKKLGEKPKNDLLDLLLDSSINDDGNGNGNKKHNIRLSLEEVIDECKSFYGAGQLTTATLLVWTLILLGKHQDWQKRAREEVLNTIGHDTPEFHGLSHLKTVNMILQEALRLYPPAPELDRTVCQDIKVGDTFLPTGVLVHLQILDAQLDEDLWGPDAKEFNPERFNEGIAKASGGNMAFFTFGWGPRICLGSNFVMNEVRIALSFILQRFEFELSPSYVHAPAQISTVLPQFGAQIILKQLCQ